MPHYDVGDDNSYRSQDTVSPLAVAAYIGDLHTLGYLSSWLLTTCVAYMVNNFGRPFHLRCIEMILERANSYPVPRLEPLYVLECLGTIRQRVHRLFGNDISTVSLTFIYFSWASFNVYFLARRSILSPTFFIVSCSRRILQQSTGSVRTRVHVNIQSRSLTWIRSLPMTMVIRLMTIRRRPCRPLLSWFHLLQAPQNAHSISRAHLKSLIQYGKSAMLYMPRSHQKICHRLIFKNFLEFAFQPSASKSRWDSSIFFATVYSCNFVNYT